MQEVHGRGGIEKGDRLNRSGREKRNGARTVGAGSAKGGRKLRKEPLGKDKEKSIKNKERSKRYDRVGEVG